MGFELDSEVYQVTRGVGPLSGRRGKYVDDDGLRILRHLRINAYVIGSRGGARFANLLA